MQMGIFNIKEFLKDLLSFHEITTIDGEKKAYVDIYKRSWYEVDYFLIKDLIECNILELDSGNWETGERHFFIDSRYRKFSDLKWKLIPDNRFGKLLDALLIIEKNEIRKLKIKKIENESRILCT